MKSRNSHTIAYTNTHQSLSFGQILNFFGSKHTVPVAVVKKFSIINTKEHFKLTIHSLDGRIFPVAVTDTIENISVYNIKEKCIFINVDNLCNFSRFTCTSQLSVD